MHEGVTAVGLLLSLVALGAAASASTADSDATCAAGGGCTSASAGEVPHYYWPSARGRHEAPSRSPYKGPKNLTTSLAWKWNHPEGQYRVVLPAAPLIDDKKNLYLATTEQLFKFDEHGRTLWTHTPKSRTSDNPSIWNGSLYYVEMTGFLTSLDMETGEVQWQARLTDSIGGDIASVTAHEGRVYASGGMSKWGGCTTVFCSNATDGTQLWEVKTQTPLWNFIPMFPGDGNVVFQTENGDPYVVKISDGSVVWSQTREFGWTDGGTIIGPNGVAYTVHADGHIIFGQLSPTQTSDITAYRASDGKQLWRHQYPTPPNSWPVMAQIGEERRWTVLFPYGGQAAESPIQMAWSRLPNSITPLWVYTLVYNLYLALGRWGKYVYQWLFWLKLQYPWPGGVTAFEPETGKVIWEWQAPDWWWPEVKGDDVGVYDRMGWVVRGKLYGQSTCIPNPWSSPTVDADGTAYLGFQDGILYALRERGGKGEVSDSFETTAGFGHPGASMAPGMLAIANCDTLYVFKYES